MKSTPSTTSASVNSSRPTSTLSFRTSVLRKRTFERGHRQSQSERQALGSNVDEHTVLSHHRNGGRKECHEIRPIDARNNPDTGAIMDVSELPIEITQTDALE